MKKTLSLFGPMLAALLAIAWNTAFAFNPENTDSSVTIDSSSAILPGTSTVIADIGMPPPLIVDSFESANQLDSMPVVDVIGHYRDSVATAPPLINTLFPNTALNLISASGNNDLAGGILDHFVILQQTADYWSGSGAQSTGTTTSAVDHDTSPPHGTQASSSA